MRGEPCGERANARGHRPMRDLKAVTAALRYKMLHSVSQGDENPLQIPSSLSLLGFGTARSRSLSRNFDSASRSPPSHSRRLSPALARLCRLLALGGFTCQKSYRMIFGFAPLRMTRIRKRSVRYRTPPIYFLKVFGEFEGLFSKSSHKTKQTHPNSPHKLPCIKR